VQVSQHASQVQGVESYSRASVEVREKAELLKGIEARDMSVLYRLLPEDDGDRQLMA
jgi:hypothetical protein